MKKDRPLPTLEEINECLDYSKETGLFTHKRSRPGVTKGKSAGTYEVNGYRKLCVYGKMVLAHHVVWLLEHGRWPKDGMVIHHKNGRRDDNRPENLAEVTQEQNIDESPHAEAIREVIASGVHISDAMRRLYLRNKI